MNSIKVKKLNNNAIIPKYMSSGASGFDFHSTEELVLKAGEFQMVGTGLAFELSDNSELQVRPRSGLSAKHGITVLNSPGTVDSDYRGEVKIILINHSKDDYKIKIGERIAQGVIANLVKVSFTLSDTINEKERGNSGFGSTGKN